MVFVGNVITREDGGAQIAVLVKEQNGPAGVAKWLAVQVKQPSGTIEVWDSSDEGTLDLFRELVVQFSEGYELTKAQQSQLDLTIAGIKQTIPKPPAPQAQEEPKNEAAGPNELVFPPRVEDAETP